MTPECPNCGGSLMVLSYSRVNWCGHCGTVVDGPVVMTPDLVKHCREHQQLLTRYVGKHKTQEKP